MSHPNNTLMLEAAQADFDMCLSRRDWKNAEIIIENLWDNGFIDSAVYLRKLFIQRQADQELTIPELAGFHYELVPDEEPQFVGQEKVEARSSVEELAKMHGVSVGTYQNIIADHELNREY